MYDTQNPTVGHSSGPLHPLRPGKPLPYCNMLERERVRRAYINLDDDIPPI